MSKMNEFVTEEEAQKLAKEHIENYMNACNCQSIEDAKLASQKMLAVAYECFEVVNKGHAEPVSKH